MQGEDGRRRRSPFAESTNSGSSFIFVPLAVLSVLHWKKQLNVAFVFKLNPDGKAETSSLEKIQFFIPLGNPPVNVLVVELANKKANVQFCMSNVLI